MTGRSGHCVAQLRIIMRPLNKPNQSSSWADRFLAYVQRFDVVPQSTGTRDLSTNMHVLKRAIRSGGERLGDVIALTQIRAYANLIPRFGNRADPRLASHNAFEHSREFLLNKFFDKNIFYPLSI